jgi:hypothetical protein
VADLGLTLHLRDTRQRVGLLLPSPDDSALPTIVLMVPPPLGGSERVPASPEVFRPSSAIVQSPVTPGLFRPGTFRPRVFYTPRRVTPLLDLPARWGPAALVGFKAGGAIGGPCPPGGIHRQKGAGSSLPTEVNRTYALPWVTRAAILSSDGCQAPDAVGTPLTRILTREHRGGGRHQ